MRDFLADLFTLPASTKSRATRRENIAVALIAGFVGAWVFLYKLEVFRGLGTTDDLFQFAQLSVSWLNGQFLHDNHYGNHLSIHTYLFNPALAVFVLPFGPAGLLLAAGIAAALSVFAMERILRHHGVPAGVAIPAALVIGAMPLSLNFYLDEVYGFHIELLAPALALWLAYFLFRRRWAPSLVIGVALLALKEDSPLIVATVAGIVLVDEALGRFLRNGSRAAIETWNRPATAVFAAAVVVLPVLLLILRAQTPGEHSPGSFNRISLADGDAITGVRSLAAYSISNFGAWLKSAPVQSWLVLSLGATLGMVLLRPHLLLLGVTTTFVAWLMKGDILWAPRFAHSLAFFQLVACLGFISVIRSVREISPRGRRIALPVVGAVLLVIAVVSLQRQASAAPASIQIYRFDPILAIPAADRRDADALFARYERESMPADPVVASLFLFRYAHYRSLYWPANLAGRPQPKWILWDQRQAPLGMLRTNLNVGGTDLAKYRLLDSRGPFLLYRAKTPEELTDRSLDPVELREMGAVRIRVRLPAKPPAGAEPLVVAGAPGAATLAYLRGIDGSRIALGVEFWGAGVLEGDPFVPELGADGIVEIVVAAPIFYPELRDPRWGDTPIAEQEARRNRVRVQFDGKLVLDRPIVHAPQRQLEIGFGENPVGGSFVAPKFSGKVLESSRLPLPGP